MVIRVSDMTATALAVLSFASVSTVGSAFATQTPKPQPDVRPHQPQQHSSPPVFKKDFVQPMSIPEEGIAGVVEVLRSGRLDRYSTASAEASQVSQLERELADWAGVKFALGLNSCSSAIIVAMLCCGVKPGDGVLCNGFTFTAIPSSILRIGGSPVLVECLNK